MARSPKGFRRYSWDSCSWIALIWDEKIKTDSGAIENRGALCRAILDAAAKGGSEVCTSALSLVEVSKHPAKEQKDSADKIKAFFENDYIVVVPLDRRVGEFARELMQRGYAGLKPPDAAHLASAAIVNADELHTFDAKLLALDERIEKADGTKLKICKPSTGGPPLPLLDQPQTEEENDAQSGDEESGGAGVDEASSDQSAPIRAGGEGTGLPGGRDGVRPEVEADSGNGTDPKAPAAKASQEDLKDGAAARTTGEVAENPDVAGSNPAISVIHHLRPP